MRGGVVLGGWSKVGLGEKKNGGEDTQKGKKPWFFWKAVYSRARGGVPNWEKKNN